MTQPKQLVLDLKTDPTFAPSDFYPSQSNQTALSMVDQWPNWPSHCLLIYGPKGCGKTHLSHIWQAKTGAKFIQLSDLNDMNLETYCQQHPHLVLDNLSPNQNEKTLLHLFNTLKEQEGSLLLSTNLRPEKWKFSLPDLDSRLQAIPHIPIDQPDDQLLSAIIVKLFADRQIKVKEAVINYILTRAERSFRSVYDCVEKINQYSLATQRPITVPLIREALT